LVRRFATSGGVRHHRGRIFLACLAWPIGCVGTYRNLEPDMQGNRRYSKPYGSADGR
jgi:hypothetical protein